MIAVNLLFLFVFIQFTSIFSFRSYSIKNTNLCLNLVLNKSNLIDKLSESTKLKKVECGTIINAFTKIIKDEILENKNSLNIKGFGIL